MKKWLMGLLVLALCVVLLPVPSQADDEAELTEFTLENAKAMISENEWEGVTGSIKQVGIKFWRLSAMERAELTDELEESGYLGIYYSDEVQLEVMLQDYGMDLEEYKAAVEDAKYKNIREETINGRKFVLYDESRKKNNYIRVAATEEDGQILEFIYFYDTKSQDNQIDVMIATIRESDSESK